MKLRQETLDCLDTEQLLEIWAEMFFFKIARVLLQSPYPRLTI